MSAAPRSGNAHNRSASLSISNCDMRPAVIAHKRGSSLMQRPHVATSGSTNSILASGGGGVPPPPANTTALRGVSTLKGKKGGAAKPCAAPVSAEAKRIAAKGTSLRTRMPYLRPNASQLPATPADSEAVSQHLQPHPPRRSFSTSASAGGSAPCLKASYTAIPEGLQMVKKVCAASKDIAEKESSVMMVGSANVRERRISRSGNVTSGKGTQVSEEATTVIQNIEVIQGMLFSSLQTTTAVEALSPLSPQRDVGTTAGSHFQRSKSCNSQLESPLISSASGLFLSRKDRRKAWTLLLHKHTHVFPILVNAARSSLAMREAKVVATILTFLYNVLRHITGERQRKAVLLCEKLGLIRVCTAVLQENRRRLRFEAATSANRGSCLRACEAAGLLFTLGNTFNLKLSSVFRLSQSLDCTLACAVAVFAVLEVEFATFQRTVQLDKSGGSLRETMKAYTEAHTRKETLKALRSFQACTQCSVTAFSHFCFTMFVFTTSAASVKELGTRAAEVCSTAIAMTTYFFSQVTPVLLTNVVYERPEDTLHPAVGPLVAIDHDHWAPLWVVKLLRHIELMLVWCVALLHRLGSCGKIQKDIAAVALRCRVPRGCSIFLAAPSANAVHLAPRRECIHVVLLLLTTLLDAERAGTLTDLSDFGGLKTLVTSILALNEASPQQWHHYYIQLATMYGCLRLPAITGCPPCYVDQRVPTSLRRLLSNGEDATANNLGASGPKEGRGGSSITNTPLRGPCAAHAVIGQPSSCNAALTASLTTTPLTKDAEPHAPLQQQRQLQQQYGAGNASSRTNTTSTQYLSPVEKFASVPEVGPGLLFPHPSGGILGNLKDGLLLVDTQPSTFSPELHRGTVDPISALGEFNAEGQQLPWPFTDAAPPTTASHWQGKPSCINSVAEDGHLQVPLKDVPQEDRVRVLRHHIARLARLDETACDATTNPHLYKVVFERLSSAEPNAAAAAATAAVQPSHDGVLFFSDFESGNLQRAVEVADNEFDLVLAWDTATNSYTQWFNFGLRNFVPGKTYHFNILNMEKLGSTFNEGQKPLLLHVPDTNRNNSVATRMGDSGSNTSLSKEPPEKTCARNWQRVGQNIFYFRNTYERPARDHFFPKDMDICGGAGSTNGSTSPVGAGGLGSTNTTPTTNVPSRYSPVRPTACSPAPRLSPSRTPPTPPPVFPKKRITTATATAVLATPPTQSAYHHAASDNQRNNNYSGGADDGEDSGKKQKNYFTVTFSVTMPSEGGGRVYLANCFPFTYTELRQHLSWLAGPPTAVSAADSPSPISSATSPVLLTAQSLCLTPGGLEVPLLTVTALHRRDSGELFTSDEIRRRPLALLVARVHPGETNASWVMQGLLDALVRPTAATAAWSSLLCENFVFKIVPMLNVDGVMMGNHRCSLAGIDMNRDYVEPKAELNPTLYALKRLLRYWKSEEGRQTVLFADFHGHSRAKNFLVYGCTSETMRGIAHYLGGKDGKPKGRVSGGVNGGGVPRRRRVRVRQTSTDAPLGPEKLLAALLNHVFPSFSLSQSSYAVTKDKVSSARVVLYDEFGVRMSYGFEATMVGGRLSVPEMLQPLTEPLGTTNGALWEGEVHYSPAVFRAMGDAFVRAFAALSEEWITVTTSAAAVVAAAGARENGDKLDKGAHAATGRYCCSAEVIQALWSATAAAGSGRDAPQGFPEEIAKDASLTSGPRAGPYAIATRGERRHGTNNTAAAGGSPSFTGPGAGAIASSAALKDPAAVSTQHHPTVSAAGQLDALNYLFLTDEREATQPDNDDDERLTVDGSDVSSAVEGSDTEVNHVVGAVVRKGGRARRGAGGGGGSEGGDGSPSSAPSDSGSDDHEWSGFNSSASSEGENDIDVERSRASSVDESIPTNLFM